jgi:hypothetical protein
VISNLMCRVAGTSGTTGGIAVAVPTYVREQSLRLAAWRAAATAAMTPAHVPATSTKREADFVPSGIPGGGPPV